LVAGRFLDSNEVNNVKDLFLPCEASALFQQVFYSKLCSVSAKPIIAMKIVMDLTKTVLSVEVQPQRAPLRE
jgi:hypothetical protein